MPNTIRIARGLKSSMPPLSDGQLYMCRDTGELYVGNNGNKPLVLAGTAEHAGMVRLNGAVDSASTNEAATPNAVRQAYNLANEAAQAADDGSIFDYERPGATYGVTFETNGDVVESVMDTASGRLLAKRETASRRTL